MTDLTTRMRNAMEAARRQENHFIADTLAESIAQVEAYHRYLDRREYAIARPASMPDMSGKPTYTLIVGATFPTWERADSARQRVPSLRGVPALIVSRIAPGSDWEEEND